MDLLIGILVLLIFAGVTTYNLIKAKLNIKNIILVGLFAALTIVGARINVPLPYVPITLQLFFCLMSGLLLGSRLGMLSQLVYVILGLIGIPAFTKGGGIYYIFEPTFGYVLGFIIAAYVTGKIIELVGKHTLLWYIIGAITGMMIIYVIGVPYLYLAKNFIVNSDATFSFWSAIKYGFLLTVIKDIVSCLLVATTTVFTKRALIKSNLI